MTIKELEINITGEFDQDLTNMVYKKVTAELLSIPLVSIEDKMVEEQQEKVGYAKFDDKVETLLKAQVGKILKKGKLAKTLRKLGLVEDEERTQIYTGAFKTSEDTSKFDSSFDITFKRSALPIYDSKEFNGRKRRHPMGFNKGESTPTFTDTELGKSNTRSLAKRVVKIVAV